MERVHHMTRWDGDRCLTSRAEGSSAWAEAAELLDKATGVGRRLLGGLSRLGHGCESAG